MFLFIKGVHWIFRDKRTKSMKHFSQKEKGKKGGYTEKKTNILFIMELGNRYMEFLFFPFFFFLTF